MSDINESKNVVDANDINVGGDFIVGDNITNITTDKPVFSDVNLEAYEKNEYVSPNFTGQLILKFSNPLNRLMVITGFYGFDKTTFCKHLALKLVEDLEIKGEKLTVKECQITSDFYSLSTAINEFEDDGVFILNNIKPKDVNHNLDELKNVANKHRNKIFIILNTDVPQSSWKITNPSYWYSIEQDGLHYDGNLTVPFIYKKTSLIKYILNACELRKLSTFKDDIKDVLNKAINTEIFTPEQLDIFLDVFQTSPSHDEKKIWEIVRKTKKKDKLISQWFMSLPENKKLTVIGMTLLDGVYEEQFFAVMDLLNQNIWNQYNDAILSLDFIDLNMLLHFFHFTEGENPSLQSKFPNQRFLTLSVLWSDYQRRISASIPILVELVNSSVGNVYTSWELYGSRDKRVRLREVISEVLSDIGRNSPKAVEHALLSFASHDDIGVQIVAAKALARWRELFEDITNNNLYNKEKELFNLLNQWIADSRFLSLVETIRSMMNENKEGSRNSSSAYIRSTIILTLGYASFYDTPNNLKTEILDLLNKLIRDRHKTVIERLQRTVRIILRNHPKQVGSILFDLGKSDEVIFKPAHRNLYHFVYPIAYGLADAHNDFPNNVEYLIEQWLSYCRTTQSNDPEILNFREEILSIVILILGLIDYNKSVTYNLEEAIKELEILRKSEHRDRIRFLLLNVILVLNEKYYEELKTVSSRVIPNMESDERERIVKSFKKRYLKQRSELTGGDYEIKINGYEIESWIDKELRPKTAIEKLIKKWLNSNNKSLINIACQALIVFAKINGLEEEKVEAFQKSIEEQKQQMESLTTQKRKYEGELKASFIDSLFIRDEVAKSIITLAKQDNNVGRREIKLLAIELERMGKKKAASQLNSLYVKLFTK